jgi:plasmid stabilization system protein ParE
MNTLKVYLSPTAKRQFEKLCQYLTEEWSVKTKNDFVNRLDRKFTQISSQPKSCPESQEINGLRKSVLDKRTSFYYRIHTNSIEV